MKVKQLIVLDEHLAVNERKGRVYEMAADSVGGQLLIGLAAEKRLPKDMISFVEERIFNNPNAVVRVQAGEYFKRPGTTRTYSIRKISALKANDQRGKALFASGCASCHKAGDEGGNIGPDLLMIGQKFDKTALLDAIINPSAAIVFGYEAWLINTKDGRSFYGFLLSENKEGIVIKDISGAKHSIAISDISSKVKQKKSIMPAPENNDLNEQQLADVAAYLLKKPHTKAAK